MIIETNKPEETYAYAKQLSENAKPGEVFTLTGDLGVGKTVFTKGFAAGLAVEEYTSGRLPFYHFDVYRIGDIEELDEIGFEDYLYGDGVCMIEWANLIEDALPTKRTDIVIEKDLERGFDYRRITVEEHNE